MEDLLKKAAEAAKKFNSIKEEHSSLIKKIIDLANKTPRLASKKKYKFHRSFDGLCEFFDQVPRDMIDVLFLINESDDYAPLRFWFRPDVSENNRGLGIEFHPHFEGEWDENNLFRGLKKVDHKKIDGNETIYQLDKLFRMLVFTNKFFEDVDPYSE